jgi:hypothetical protein
MVYRVQEGSLTLDGKWLDRTVNVFLPVRALAEGANLVLARDVLPPETSVADYAVKQRETFQKQLKAFSVLRDVPGNIDGRPAHLLEFTWIADDKTVYQAYVSIQHEGAVLNFTATIPQSTEDVTLRKFLLQTISSFKFAPPSDSAPK